jgi:hypothetical protein
VIPSGIDKVKLAGESSANKAGEEIKSPNNANKAPLINPGKFQFYFLKINKKFYLIVEKIPQILDLNKDAKPETENKKNPPSPNDDDGKLLFSFIIKLKINN